MTDLEGVRFSESACERVVQMFVGVGLRIAPVKYEMNSDAGVNLDETGR